MPTLKLGIVECLDTPAVFAPGEVVDELALWSRVGGSWSRFRKALIELFREGEIDYYDGLVCRLPSKNGKRKSPPDSWTFDPPARG